MNTNDFVEYIKEIYVKNYDVSRVASKNNLFRSIIITGFIQI